MFNHMLKTLEDYVQQDRVYIFTNNLREKELSRLGRSGLYHQMVLAPITGTVLLDSMQNTVEAPWLWAMAIVMQSIYLRYVIRNRTANEKRRMLRESQLEAVVIS